MNTNLITEEQHRNREAGIAYVVLLIYLTIMTCLGLSFIQKVGLEAKIVMNKTISSQAHSLARSAASHAMWGMLNVPGFAPDGSMYYMHSLANGRYGYKVRKPTETTFATIAAIGVMGESVVEQGYVPYIIPSNVYTAYGSTSSGIPLYRRLIGADWNAPNDVLLGGGNGPRWVELEGCPVRNELIAGAIDGIGEIKVAVYDGTTWGNAEPFGHGDQNYKCFDIAYESQSGDALVVSRDGTATPLYYDIWDGTGWVYGIPQTAINLPGGDIHDVVMASQPGGDEILIAVVTSWGDIQLVRWDGSAFSDLGTIETVTARNDFRVVEIVYEHQSGDAMVVWSRSSDSALKFRMWNGVALGPEGDLPDFGGNANYVIRGAADSDPTSDYIVIGAVDNFYDLSVAIWDGDNWIDSREIEIATSTNTCQVFDVAWEAAGEDVVIAWAPWNVSNVRSMAWKKGTALADCTIEDGPVLPDGWLVRLLPISGTEKIVLLGEDQYSDLRYCLWAGDNFKGDPAILLEPNVPVQNDVAFDLAEANVPRTGGTGSGSGGGNLAPTVNAGPDQSICPPGLMADLDGTVTDDGLPNPPATVTTIWSTVSGPGTVTFDDPLQIDTVATFSEAGEYVLRLRANDGELQDFDEVTITLVDPDEILVNTETVDTQSDPVLAVASDGRYVITWESLNQDGDSWGVYGQLFDANGVAVGGEFPVNTSTTGAQRNPSVAMDDAGNFVIAWQTQHVYLTTFNVFAQRFDANGVKQGSEFRVDAAFGDDVVNPSVAMDADGDFVIAFENHVNHDGDGWGIYARRYDNAGASQGGGFKVNTYYLGNQSQPSVAMDDVGNFVVTWTCPDQDGSFLGVYAQLYDASGTKKGSEFQVNTTTDNDQHFSNVAMDSAGNFVVVWEGLLGTSPEIYLQRFDSIGTMLGSETLANSTTADSQLIPKVDMNTSGEFVVSWYSNNQDGSGYGVYARRYSAAGNALGGEFLINTTTTGDQVNPDIGVDQEGHFAVTWDGNGTGDTNGVFMSLFPCSSGAFITPGPLLFVVGNPSSLTSADLSRKVLFESWGYTVNLINDGDSQSNIDSAIAANDVVYAGPSAQGPSMLDKFNNANKGIVNEVYGKLDNFGFCSSTGLVINSSTVSIVDNTHYITSDFMIGLITVFNSTLGMHVPSGTLAPDLQNLAEAPSSPGQPAVVALESGAQLYGGGNAPARRVHLPYYNADLGDLTADGELIMKRAIEWAASGGGGGGSDTDPPTPDPMTWATPPAPDSPTSVRMMATTASDPSGVMYYFECTSGGCNDSGWQDNPIYIDSGLTTDTSYTYRVKATDKASPPNETGWSTEETATTPSAPEMFVNDIAMGFRKQGPKYFGQATVWIKDDMGMDVTGALVVGDWSGAVSEGAMGTTGGDGKIFFESGWVNGGGTYTFTVTDVTKSGYVYNPVLNVMTSNSITVP